MEDIILELQEYANMEGTEIGELCWALIAVHGHSDYMSDECRIAIEEEIKWNLRNFKNNTEIVESEKTYTEKVKELNWL